MNDKIVEVWRPLLLYAVCMKVIKHVEVMGATPHRVLVTVGQSKRGLTSLWNGEIEPLGRELLYMVNVDLVSGRVRVSH